MLSLNQELFSFPCSASEEVHKRPGGSKLARGIFHTTELLACSVYKLREGAHCRWGTSWPLVRGWWAIAYYFFLLDFISISLSFSSSLLLLLLLVLPLSSSLYFVQWLSCPYVNPQLILFFSDCPPHCTGLGSEQAAESCCQLGQTTTCWNPKSSSSGQAFKHWSTSSRSQGLDVLHYVFKCWGCSTPSFFSGWLIGFSSDILEESFHSNYLAVRRCDILNVFSSRKEEIMLGDSWNYTLPRQNEVLEPILNCWIN